MYRSSGCGSRVPWPESGAYDGLGGAASQWADDVREGFRTNAGSGAKARLVDFPGDGDAVRFPADAGWLRQQRSAGLRAVAGQRADDEGHHQARGDNADHLPGDCSRWLHWQHHAGVERAADGCRRGSGLGDSGNRIAADLLSERGGECRGDQCAGDADGHWSIGESAGLELDYAQPDADLVGSSDSRVIGTN